MANLITEKNLWIARGWEDNKPVSSRVRVYTLISDALSRVTPFISLPKELRFVDAEYEVIAMDKDAYMKTVCVSGRCHQNSSQALILS